jgi:hypothetical protein
MKTILQLIDKLLSILPFNGNKSKLGGLLSLFFAIQTAFPGFDFLPWLDMSLAKLGVPVLIIGLIHKAVKDYVDKNNPQLLSNSSAKAVAVVDPVSKIPVQK